ncbi:hypothetical protein BS17DRAFT_798021 [Gyrodon lividus]|nr:hypothetical protein BS17DRAFT_798021 [Gyrodon lividus]
MDVLRSLVREAVPPKATFSVEDIPDFSEVISIGKETARALLAHGAKVYSEEIIRQLKQGNEVIFLELDLANMKTIKAAVEESLRLELVTVDGYDLQLGTNVLGHYFTKLLPTVITTARTAANRHARVVTISSSSHLQGRSKATQALLKLSGNAVFATALARRYSDQGIASTSLNPGQSDLDRNLPAIARSAMTFMPYDTPKGALAQLYAWTAPALAQLNGECLVPWPRISSPRDKTQDPELGRKLWDWLEEQVKDL